MSRSTDLGIKLALAVMLLSALACGLGPTPTPQPVVNTLAAGPQYLGPTLSSPSEYRPSAAGWIAFLKDNNLWLVHPDGTDAKQVTNNDASAGSGQIRFAWSADGQLLAYSQGGVLSILNVAGLATTVLAKNTAGGFGWSATAHQIVYDTAVTTGASGSQSNDGLAVVSADDNSTRPLANATPAHPAMLNPLWSFDSRSVIFSDAKGGPPLLLQAETGKIIGLLPGGSAQAECSWSPVELVIACVDGNPPQGQAPGVLLLDQEGAQQKRIPLPDGHAHPHLGPWSPDGGLLTLSYSSGPEGFQEQTDMLSLDTGGFEKLGPGRASSWSPDGRWIVMEASGADAQPMTVLNTISGLSATIADGSSPAWQPSASTDLTMSAGTVVPQAQSFCMDASAGFVHKKPKGYYLQFCIGANKYNYGALASGVYIVGPQTRYFVYVSNGGYVFAARMGDPTLTRIGNVRSFIAIHASDLDPNFELRFITGYPHLVQVVELRYKQKETFTLPKRIYMP
jgi:Tol biopolymer transport system component